MKGRLVGALVLAAVMLVLSWSVSFAAAPGNADSGQVIQVAPVDGRPVMNVYHGGIASVTPGDLYVVDARNAPQDLPVVLHLLNAGELVKSFRYVIFEIGVWRVDAAGNRTRLTAADGTPLGAVVSLLDADVSFVLPGGAKYVVTIDGGSYASYPAGSGGAAVLPQFVLSAD